MANFHEDINFIMYISDGIVYSVPKQGCVITREVSRAMIVERIRISKGIVFPVILDGRLVKYWTMDSRNNDMQDKSYDLVKCAAIVIKSKALKIMWNYASRMFPLPVPSKVFNELEEAKLWVEKYK